MKKCVVLGPLNKFHFSKRCQEFFGREYYATFSKCNSPLINIRYTFDGKIYSLGVSGRIISDTISFRKKFFKLRCLILDGIHVIY